MQLKKIKLFFKWYTQDGLQEMRMYSQSTKNDSFMMTASYQQNLFITKKDESDEFKNIIYMLETQFYSDC